MHVIISVKNFTFGKEGSIGKRYLSNGCLPTSTVPTGKCSHAIHLSYPYPRVSR